MEEQNSENEYTMAYVGFGILLTIIIIVLIMIQSKKGRYVFLERVAVSGTGVEELNISEIVIYDNDNNPIKPVEAKAGSMYSAQKLPMINLIDGNADTFAHTLMSPDKKEDFSKQWFSIDLGEDKQISKIVIKNRKDCCQGRLAGTRLRIANSSNKDIFTSATINATDAVKLTVEILTNL